MRFRGFIYTDYAALFALFFLVLRTAYRILAVKPPHKSVMPIIITTIALTDIALTPLFFFLEFRMALMPFAE